MLERKVGKERNKMGDPKSGVNLESAPERKMTKCTRRQHGRKGFKTSTMRGGAGVGMRIIAGRTSSCARRIR